MSSNSTCPTCGQPVKTSVSEDGTGRFVPDDELPSDVMTAMFLHETYEKIAIEEGWQTQQKTKVRFDELPETNRTTMVRTSRRLLYWLKNYKQLNP